MLGNFTTLILKKIKFNRIRRQRAQVFILATLLIVVYGISIITVISEFSIRKFDNDDQLKANDLLGEFLREMDYQMQIVLYNQTNGLSTSSSDIELFQESFRQYLLIKGFQATFTFQPGNFIINALAAPIPLGSLPTIQMINTTAQTSVNLFSSEDYTIITGNFIHFTGLEISVNGLLITIRQVDISGETIHYFSNVETVRVNGVIVTPINYNNGSFGISPAITVSDTFNVTLNNGIRFYST